MSSKKVQLSSVAQSPLLIVLVWRFRTLKSEHVTDLLLDISYQFTFMQPNGRTLPKDPWSLRQIGLYSRCCSKPSFSSFIVLFPTPLDESEVYSRLKNEGPSGTSATSFENNPINVHLLFLATYLHNWQTYLEVLADDFRTMVCSVTVCTTGSRH